MAEQVDDSTHATDGQEAFTASEHIAIKRQFLVKYYKNVIIQGSASASVPPSGDQLGASAANSAIDFSPELVKYYCQMFKVSTVVTDLSQLGLGEALAVVVSVVEEEHQVLIIRRDTTNVVFGPQQGQGDHYVTGISLAIPAAFKRLQALIDAYVDRKSAGWQLANQQHLNGLAVYGTTLAHIPLVISEPGRLVLRKLCRQISSTPPGQLNDAAVAPYITVDIYTGDLLQTNVDVIVSASDTNLSFSGGVARLIRQRAGEVVELEARMQVPGGILRLTDTVVTSGGALTHIQHIIHAAGPALDCCVSRDQCEQLLTDTLCNCVLRAEQVAATSLALPAIGSGNGGIPLDIVANAFCNTVMTYLVNRSPSQTLTHISLVLIDDVSTDSIRHHFVKRLSQAGCLEADVGVLVASPAPAGVLTSAVSGSTTAPGAESTNGCFVGASASSSSSTSLVASGSGTSMSVTSMRSVSGGLCCCCRVRLQRDKKHMRPCGHRCCRTCQASSRSCTKCKTRNFATTASMSTAAASALPFRLPAHTRQSAVHTHSMGYDFSGILQAVTNGDVTDEAESQKVVNSAASPPVLAGHTDDCVICMDVVTEPRRLDCGHVFCKACIEQHLVYQAKCPTCGKLQGAPRGNQPPGGSMSCSLSHADLPGYPGTGSIVIHYHMPSGIQRLVDPHPGRPYQGTSRTAFLPNTAEGLEVYALLRRAFDAGLTFTIGRSATTGRDDVIIWNDIHHKTSNFPGDVYGYPDVTYLSRVKEELAAKGIVTEQGTG